MKFEGSKSRRKRDHQALRELGRELVGLSDRHLAELDLPENVVESVREARRLARGALQRQLRYIGGCLAEIDTEVVRERLQQLMQPSLEEVRRFHAIERWRDRLLDEAETAMAELLAAYPQADAQQLRQLVRGAARESTAGKPPRSARELFRVLRDLLDAGD